MAAATFFGFFLLSLINLCVLPQLALASITRHYKFDIKWVNVTRLCHTKSMATVNGKFPGPPIVARDGDRIVVEVFNHSPKNITIHWHGIRQLQTGWYDGPAYITQCPIQPRQSFVYNFSTTGQRGTLLYHAHINWLRSTVYGPIVILPKPGVPYPFPKPYKEVNILFGEWFNADADAIINQSLVTGAGPNVSNAYTINGLPGPFYNCSAKDTYKLKVESGKTYLLRLVNAALNDELFIGIANHSVTVVEMDGSYTKPFETNTILLTPGQTANVLLRTKPYFPDTNFFIAAIPYATGSATFDNSTVAGILEYKSPDNRTPKQLPVLKPNLPSVNDTAYFYSFVSQLRSLGSPC